jgi:hypothetical protein
LIEELEADTLLRRLVEHEVEFVVIGGLAVAAHGYVRATKDLDVMPNPDRENLGRLFEALGAVDARPIETDEFRPEELPVPFDPDGLAHGGNWALRTRHGRIDLMQWVPGVNGYGQLRANALLAHVTDVGPIMFAGYEDLLSMKRAAGRDVDLLDVARLEQARGAS